MGRDVNGNYTLPSAVNPVVTGTSIASTWANTTLSDVATELTSSLDRSGRGGMLAAMRGIDGSILSPAISFSSETSTGFYRSAAGIVGLSLLNRQVFLFSNTNVMESIFVTAGSSTTTGIANAGIATAGVANSYLQNDIHNNSTGVLASSDWIATADTGTDTTNFVDVGINGSGFVDATWTISGALDSYLYASDGALTVGTKAAKSISFHTGGTLAANIRGTISSAGNWTINAPTSGSGLTVTGNTGAYAATLTAGGGAIGALSIGGGTVSQMLITGSAAGTSAIIINTCATTGAQTATFSATNKPGAAAQTTPTSWIPIQLDGAIKYIPAFT